MENARHGRRSKKSDQRYVILSKWVAECIADSEDESLPDITAFNDFYYAFEVYRKMKGMDWRFLPDGTALLDQDEALWSDLSKIAMLERKIEKIIKPSKAGTKNG